MNIRKISALTLAIALQLLPICRVACLTQALASTQFAVVLKWMAGAAVLLGSFHAVSGASAAVAGVASTSPPGPVTTNATGKVGQALSYRIIVTNPGINHSQDFWNAVPLPPGVTINTNIGGNGYITGTPTAAWSHTVTLTAGNANYAKVATLDILMTIQGKSSPPSITGPPQSQTVAVGADVTFTVTATGAAPLSYRWIFAGTNITGAAAATLRLTNVQTGNAGTYTVIVSNADGSATNSATLTVNQLPQITLQPQDKIAAAGANVIFTTAATGTGLVYQWLFNGSTLGGPASPTLTLSNVTPAQSGLYSAVVSNSVGKATSSGARLLVVPAVSATSAPELALKPAGPNQVSISFTALAGYSYSIQQNADPSSGNWTVITNLPPAWDQALILIPQATTDAPQSYYRAVVTGP